MIVRKNHYENNKDYYVQGGYINQVTLAMKIRSLKMNSQIEESYHLYTLKLSYQFLMISITFESV